MGFRLKKLELGSGSGILVGEVGFTSEKWYLIKLRWFEVVWSQKTEFEVQKVGLRTRERENVRRNWVIWEDGVKGSGAE